MSGTPGKISSTTLTLDGGSLTPTQVATLARGAAGTARAEPAAGAVERMRASVALKDSLLAQDIPIYGVTTGFGDSCIGRSPGTRPMICNGTWCCTT